MALELFLEPTRPTSADSHNLEKSGRRMQSVEGIVVEIISNNPKQNV